MRGAALSVPRWVPATILAVLLAVPAYWLITFDLFPFTDLPNHLAAATIYRHLDDPHTAFAEYYVADVSPLKPNIAHLIFCSRFVSAETGNMLWMVAAVGLLGVGLVLIFRLTEATMELLPLGVLLVFNTNVSWGFVGSILGVPLLFILGAALIAHGRHLTIRSGVLVAGLLLLLYYVHVLALLYGVAFVLLCGLLSPGVPFWRKILAWGVPVLPSLILTVAWVLTSNEFGQGSSTGDFLATYYRWHYLGSVVPRLGRLLTNDFFVLAQDQRSVPLTAGFSIAILGGIVFLHRRGEALWTKNRVVVSFFITAVLAFFFLPDRLPDQAHLYSRFSVLLLGTSLVLVASAQVLRGRRWLLALATCVAGIYLYCWHGYLREFREYTAGFTRSLLAHASGGPSVLAGIVRDPEFRLSKPLVHYPNYHTIWNLGITVNRVSSYRFGAIRLRKGGRDLPEYQEWVSPDARVEELIHRYAEVDFLLFHSRNAGQGLAGVAEIARSGDWRLYASSGHR